MTAQLKGHSLGRRGSCLTPVGHWLLSKVMTKGIFGHSWMETVGQPLVLWHNNGVCLSSLPIAPFSLFVWFISKAYYILNPRDNTITVAKPLTHTTIPDKNLHNTSFCVPILPYGSELDIESVLAFSIEKYLVLMFSQGERFSLYLSIFNCQSSWIPLFFNFLFYYSRTFSSLWYFICYLF